MDAYIYWPPAPYVCKKIYERGYVKYKLCTVCGKEYTLAGFYKSRGYYKSECKDCTRKAALNNKRKA